MQLFYSTEIDNQACILSPEESRHCISVLRHVKGDTVNVFGNDGYLYTAQITDNNPKKCILTIIDKMPIAKRNGYLHIVIAPTKNMDRLEWFVEKAVEIGIEEITPIICDHSERKVLKIERLEKIIVSAMKQSQNLIFPKLNNPVECSKFLEQHFDAKKCIAYCEEKSLLYTDVIKGEKAVLTLIGPEGDFSKQEINTALANGFTPVSLGESRLRTETAGVVSSVFFSGQLTVDN